MIQKGQKDYLTGDHGASLDPFPSPWVRPQRRITHTPAATRDAGGYAMSQEY